MSETFQMARSVLFSHPLLITWSRKKLSADVHTSVFVFSEVWENSFVILGFPTTDITLEKSTLTCNSSGYPLPTILWFTCPGIQPSYVCWRCQLQAAESCEICPEGGAVLKIKMLLLLQVCTHCYQWGFSGQCDLTGRWGGEVPLPPVSWWWCHCGVCCLQPHGRVSAGLPSS